MDPKKFIAINVIFFIVLNTIIYFSFSLFLSNMIFLPILTIMVSSVLFYPMIFFVFSRVFIPHLGFSKSKIPKKLPEEIKLVIEQLKKKSKTQRDYLRNTYLCLTKRYYGKRSMILKKPSLLFEMNLKKIWKNRGFIPCHSFNYLTRLFLIKSKMFKEKDIKINHTFFNFSIHQYLEIKIKKKWIKLDPWAKNIGVKFGDYARMFM